MIHKWKTYFCFSLICFIFLLFLTRDLMFPKMWAFGDLSAFPKDIGITKNWGFYLWCGEGIGFLSFKPVNYYSIIILFSFVFGSLLAQKIVFLSTLLISFLTFYFLLRKFKVNSIPSLLGAFIYSFNPVTISEFTGGSMTLIVYAIFPLLLFYIIKITQSQEFNLKATAILGMLSFFIFNIHAAFWYILILMPILLLNKPLMNTNLKKTARLTIFLIIITLILLPNILGYTGIYGTTSSGKVPFESTAAYCYGDSTFYNIVRLAGNTGSAQAKEFLNYNTLSSYTILGYVLPIVAFLSFLIRNQHNNKSKKYLMTSAAFTFLVSSGLILIVKALPFIVDVNPILASLRNPVKLMYPLSFSLCFLFAIGIERLLIKSGKKHKRKWNIFISIILVSIILLYNYPALDGTLGLARVRGENYYIEDKYYTLSEILTEIDENYDDYRILFLPWEYPALLKTRSEIPNYFGVSVGARMAQDIEWLKNAFKITIAKNSSDRSYMLGLFGVKYIIIDNDFRSYYEGQTWYENLKKGRSYVIYNSNDAYWVTGESEYFYQIFNSDPNFEIVYENSDFAVFKNNRVITKLYTRSDVANFTLSYTSISENLLKNPSFENNIEHWRIYPGSLANITYDHQGNKMITLYGQEKWFTICYQVVPVKENVFYSLKFSVKGYNISDMHAKVLWYNISENLTEGNAFSMDYIKLYQMNLSDGVWSNVEKILSAPKEAKMARIYFLANRLKDFTSTVMCVDNVYFYETEMTIENKYEICSSIKNINYTKINPTKYITKINATYPLIIVLSETYNPSWICYINDEKITSIPLYGVINGFYINHTGFLDIVIEYEPQRWFYIGSAISITTLIACATYMTHDWTKNKNILKRVKKWSRSNSSQIPE